jgi:hypothetical protein
MKLDNVTIIGVDEVAAGTTFLGTAEPSPRSGKWGLVNVSAALRGAGLDATSGEKRKYEATVELMENRSMGWSVVLGTDDMAIDVRTRPLAAVTVTITAVHTRPCNFAHGLEHDNYGYGIRERRRKLETAWWEASAIVAAGRDRCYMQRTNGTGAPYTAGAHGYDGYATAYGDNSTLTISPSTLTFTASNWHLPQQVEVLAVDDDVAQGDRVVAIVHGATSMDMKFNDGNMATLYANVLEEDVADIASRCHPTTTDGCAAVNVGNTGAAPGATLAAGGSTKSQRESVVVTVTENGHVRYDLKLASQPYDPVNVTFYAAHFNCTTAAGTTSSSSLCAAGTGTDHSNLNFTPGHMVFTPYNWDTEQVLLVNAVNDFVAQGFRQPTIRYACSSNDARYNRSQDAYTSVTVNVTDDDAHGVGFNTMHVWATEHGQCRRQEAGCSMLGNNCGGVGLSPNRATNLISHIGKRPIMCNESGAATVASLRTCRNGGATLLCGETGATVGTDASAAFGYCKCLDGFYGYDCSETSASLNDASASCAGYAVAPPAGRGGYQVLADPAKLGLFRIKLNTIPYHAVTVAVVSSDPTQAFVQPSLLVFGGTDSGTGLSPGATGRDANHNSQQAQSVWVFAQDDYVAEDPTNVTIFLKLTSSDPGYQDLQIPQNLSATCRDDDAPRIRLHPATQGANPFHSDAHTVGSAPTWDQQLAAGVAKTVGEWQVRESDVASVYVTLGSRPTSAAGCETSCVGGAVTVAVHRYAHPDDHSEVLLSPGALVFTDTNWYVPQMLKVLAVNDPIYQFDRDTVVYFSATSADPFYSGANSYSALGDLTVGVAAPAVNVRTGSVVQNEVFPRGNGNRAGSTNTGQPSSKRVGTGTGADALKLRVLEDDVAAVIASRNEVTVVECEDRYGAGLNNYEAGVAVCGGYPNIQSYTVRLQSRPYNPVTISLRVGNGGDVVDANGEVTTVPSMVAGVQLGISPSELVFTGNVLCARGGGCGENNTGDWDRGQTVLVIAAENVLDDGTRLVNVTAKAKSNDTFLSQVLKPVSQATLTRAPTAAGSTATPAPTAAGPGASFSRKSAYHRYQHTVMNTTTKKAIIDETRGATVPIVTAKILDNEVAAVSIAPATHPMPKGMYHATPQDIRVSLVEGETTEYLVRLSVRPSHLVTVTPVPSNKEELSVLPEHLVFSYADYFEDKKFTVKAIANHVHESDRNQSVSHIVTSNSTKPPKCDYSVNAQGVFYLDPTSPCHIAYGGVPAGVVHVGITDDDGSGVRIEMIDSSTAASAAVGALAQPNLQGCVVEGASVRYRVSLTSAPTSNVTLSLHAVVDQWGTTTAESRSAVGGAAAAGGTVRDATVAAKYIELLPPSTVFTPTSWGGGAAMGTTEATVVTVRAIDNEWYEGFGPKRFNISHSAVSTDVNYDGYPTYPTNETFAPTGAPTNAPTRAPTPAATVPTTAGNYTVSGSATLSGVTAAVAAEDPFEMAFKAALAKQYSVVATTITIGAITETTSRRQRRLASLSIAYTIKASSQRAAYTLVMAAVNTTTLATDTKASYTGTASALSSMSVTAVATPTSAPTAAANTASSNSSTTAAPTASNISTASNSSSRHLAGVVGKRGPMSEEERRFLVDRSTVQVLLFDDDAGCRSDFPQYRCEGGGSECVAITERPGSEGVYLRPARPPSECSLLLSTSFQSGDVCRCEKGRGGAYCEKLGSEFQRLVMMVQAGTAKRRKDRQLRQNARLRGEAGQSAGQSGEGAKGESWRASGDGRVDGRDGRRRRLAFEVSFDNGRSWPALATALGVDPASVYVLQVVDKPCVYDATAMCSEVMCDLSGKAAKIDVMKLIREDSPSLGGLGIADVWIGPEVMPRGDEAVDAVVRRQNQGSLTTLSSLTGTVLLMALVVACYMGRKKRWAERAEAEDVKDEQEEASEAREKRMTTRFKTTIKLREGGGGLLDAGANAAQEESKEEELEEPSSALIPSSDKGGGSSRKAGIRKGGGVKKGGGSGSGGDSGSGGAATDLLLE